MHDIVTGKRTVEEARAEFGEQTAAWMMNRDAAYTERVQFARPSESETEYRSEAGAA